MTEDDEEGDEDGEDDEDDENGNPLTRRCQTSAPSNNHPPLNRRKDAVSTSYQQLLFAMDTESGRAAAERRSGQPGGKLWAVIIDTVAVAEILQPRRVMKLRVRNGMRERERV